MATFWVYSSGRSRLAVDKGFPSYQKLLYIIYFVNYHTDKLNKNKLSTPVNETKILKDRYVAPTALSPGPEALC